MAIRRARGRGAIRIVIGVFLVAGTAAGCSAVPKAGSVPPVAVTTAVVPVPATSASSGASPTASKAKSKAKATRSPAGSPSPTVSRSGSQSGATQGAAPSPTVSAPAPNPTTPTPAHSQPAGGGGAFTASCPSHASSSTQGCGSWDAGASSGHAPGFAAGQQSSPNLFDVNQDPWSGGQGQQTINASSFQNWSVTATDSDPSNAPGEVLTYPDASVNYYQVGSPAQYDLNKITSLTSDFAESMPDIRDLNAEAAYDIWLNNWQTEVMVWVDTSPGKDRNLADSGDTKVATYTFGGQKFSLWRNGSGITGFYIFLLDHSESSGTVDLKPMLETLVSLGEIPAASPLTEIPFGWEVSDTGGKPVTFSMSHFAVDLQN